MLTLQVTWAQVDVYSAMYQYRGSKGSEILLLTNLDAPYNRCEDCVILHPYPPDLHVEGCLTFHVSTSAFAGGDGGLSRQVWDHMGNPLVC
jgi:hypothetical protein